MSEPEQPQVVLREIPELLVPGRRLGRHVKHDPRSRQYVAEAAPMVHDVLHAAHGLPLNQGDLGDCTANALCAALNCGPNYSASGPAVRSYPAVEADAITLYSRETTDEGAPYPPNDPGGTGLAVCRAGQELGWLERYAHAFDFNRALRALVLRPVIAGINWYDSMDEPDSSGLVSISPNAFVRGGHEVCGAQIITADRLVVFWNSWGSGWGIQGQFAMTYDTIERLLSEQGDITVPGAAVAR